MSLAAGSAPSLCSVRIRHRCAPKSADGGRLLHTGHPTGTRLTEPVLRAVDLERARTRAIRGARRDRPHTGVWATVRHRATERPHAAAVREGGTVVTYAGLTGLVGAAQALLRARGVGPGDLVAVA